MALYILLLYNDVNNIPIGVAAAQDAEDHEEAYNACRAASTYPYTVIISAIIPLHSYN